MSDVLTTVLVAIGGAGGAASRYVLHRALVPPTVTDLRWWQRRLSSPRATLLINVVGSLLLGVLLGSALPAPDAAATAAASVAAGAAEPEHVAYGGAMALLGVGFAGAFTTFSTLALDVWTALHDGRRWSALANVTASLLLGLGAAYAGWVLSG